MNFSELSSNLSEPMHQVIQAVVSFLPSLLGAVALLALGWVFARLLKALAHRLISAIQDRLGRHAAIQRSLTSTGLKQTIPKVVSTVVFWAVFFFFISAAVERLGLTIVSSLLGSLTAYLPNLLLAAVVILAGLVAANVAAHAVRSAASSAGVRQAEILGRVVQALIVTVAVVVGADQIGLDSSFLTLAVAIIAGTTLGGVALAFGVGSGTTVNNIIAAHYFQRAYRPGQRIRLGDVEGNIREISPTEVIIDTDSGEAHIPAKRFGEETCLLLKQRSDR